MSDQRKNRPPVSGSRVDARPGMFKRALVRLLLAVAFQILMFVYRWTRADTYRLIALVLMEVEMQISIDQSRHGEL